MSTLQQLAAEFAITVSNGEVWLAIGLALLLGAGCLAFGIWMARFVGLLMADAPAGETLGVGLASGLVVLVAWWAAIWSGGRSSFTPVAVGFALALGLAVARRIRRPAAEDAATSATTGRRALVIAALAGGLFIVAIALLYGSTIAPSPRNGVQPIEFHDQAYYAILGRDLAATGTETNLSASGFSDLPGVPVQAWYHWGEVWLAAAVITVFGAAPMATRYFIVLPIVLLAAAALTGTLVRRMGGSDSRRVFAFGVLACLFLAPVPLPGTFFSEWATGMIFGIGLYGLAAVAPLLALYSAAVLHTRHTTTALVVFVGSTAAFIVPAHLAVGLLVLVGMGGVSAIRVAIPLLTRRQLPHVPPGWVRIFVASGLLLVATVTWGLLTGHGMGAGAPPIVPAFSSVWRDSVFITTLGAGVFVAIAIALVVVRKKSSLEANLYFGTLALVVAGAIAWGARFGDFTSFYLFFAGLAVIATPVAAIAVLTLWDRLRAGHHRRLAVALLVLWAIQVELGAWNGLLRLHFFGPDTVHPISVDMLAAIRQLPVDAKLAYACDPFAETGLGVPRLASIDAHTGRRVVPMCFEAEVLSALIGAQPSVEVENLSFPATPQRALYPNADARPSAAEVAAFLKVHGINYVYADPRHPNSLIPDAVLVVSGGDAEILRVP